MARTLTERIPNATYVWNAGGRDDETFIKDARTRLRVRSGVARPLLGGIPIPKDLTVLSAHLELTATEEWAGSRTMTARRLATHEPLRTLTWANQPDVHPDSAAVSVTQAGTNRVWSFDVTDDFLDALAAGEKLNGWRITSSEDAVRFFYGTHAQRPAHRPRLVMVVTKKPGAPTDLVPSRGAVSVSHPTVAWDTLLTFDSVQIQVDENEGDFTSPLWDSLEEPWNEPSFPLAGSGFPGLANLDDRDWRVRVKNDAGWSQWSLPGRLHRVDKPVVTITSPGATTSDDTPPVGWSLTGGGTQEAYRVILTDDDGEEIWDSRWQRSTALSVVGTKGLKKNGDTGTIEVRVKDDVDREATPGDPIYANDTQVTTLDTTADPGGVAWFNVNAGTVAPWPELEWGRAESPDYWRILADGERVAKVNGPDLLTGTGRYGWRDFYARPNHERTYQVQAIVDGVVTRSASITMTPRIRGVWVGDPDDDVDVLILGRDEVTAENPEQITTLFPVGGDTAINVRQGRHGLTGTVTGLLDNAFGRLGGDEAAQLRTMAKFPSRVYRLAWADKNIAVTLQNIQVPPLRVGTSEGRRRATVSFGFTEDRRG